MNTVKFYISTSLSKQLKGYVLRRCEGREKRCFSDQIEVEVNIETGKVIKAKAISRQD